MPNKVTLNALSRKHAELQAQMILAQNELRAVQANLNAVETTIKLINPSFEIETIKAKNKYSKSKFKRGEVPLLVGNYVRDSTGNFSCPEIVKSILEVKKLELVSYDIEKLNLGVYNALKRLEKNKIIVYVEKSGSTILWRRYV